MSTLNLCSSIKPLHSCTSHMRTPESDENVDFALNVARQKQLKLDVFETPLNEMGRVPTLVTSASVPLSAEQFCRYLTVTAFPRI